MPESRIKNRSKKSGAVLIIIFFAAVIAAVYLYVSNINSTDFESKAEGFFRASAQNNYAVALSYLSSNLKKSLTPAQLVNYIKQMSAVIYKSSAWNTRNLSDNLVELINSAGAGEVSSSGVAVIFIKENNDWKILSIHTAEKVKNPAELMKKIPPLDSLKSLVVESLNELSGAAASGNYFTFYNKLSQEYRLKTSEASLKKIFDEYQRQGISLKPSDEFGIVFDEVPVVLTPGVLMLKGYYPTTQYPVYFEMGYRNELSRWKLDSIKISLQDNN